MANWKEVTKRWLPIVEKMEEHSMDDYAIPEIYRAAEKEIAALKQMETDLELIIKQLGRGEGGAIPECVLLTKETNDED